MIPLFLVIAIAFLSLSVSSVAADIPTGTSYKLYDNHGGIWCDAEKRPPSDDAGNPPPVVWEEEDDLLCWAAAATNVLEWTGWGLVAGYWSTDDMLEHFMAHWNDTGGSPAHSWVWWFNGTDLPRGGQVDVPGGGNFWTPLYSFEDYYHTEHDALLILSRVDSWLHLGCGVTLGIVPAETSGGHHITCWGYNYNPLDPTEYYGIWVTDSDDNKRDPPPAPDVLKYYEVEWNGTHLLIPNYTRSYWTSPRAYCIVEAHALEAFPSTRPVADADGPYTGYEGLVTMFDGSASSDADGDPLEYRWDFDNDGVWDTEWSSSPTASHTWYDDHSGTVVLQVNDGHMLDIATASVTVTNVEPTVNAGLDQTADEGGKISFSGSYTDPGTADTHTIEWDFGDGLTALGTVTPTHAYGDDGVYNVTLTVTDDGGGVGVDTLIITVNNVPPALVPLGALTIDEGVPFTLVATSTDPGSDDLWVTWEFELGPTVTTVYFNDGVAADPYPSPWGTYPFSVTDTVDHIYADNGVYTVTLTVTDDDGGMTVSTFPVTVSNVAPSIAGIVAESPNPDNPEFILPTVHEPLFTVSAADPGSDDLTFTWAWGDGTDDTAVYYNDGMTPDPYPSPWGAYPFTASDTLGHTYAEPGTYVVTVIVADDDGGVNVATYEIHVLSAEEAKHLINDYIQGLPDDAFKSKPDKRKKAFDNMFSAVDDMLDDEEYIGATTDMLNNIRAKADGTIDGSPSNDWIVDATAQAHICWKIDALTAYLATLVPPPA